MIVDEITGRRRGRVFAYAAYLNDSERGDRIMVLFNHDRACAVGDLIETVTGRLLTTLGRGSCFAMEAPLASCTGSELVSRVERQTLQRSGEAQLADRQLRILAAGDGPVNQPVLRTLLNQAGFEPEIVSNGEEAIAAWRHDVWDVILMDVQMPVMDGITATKHIRPLEREAVKRQHQLSL